MEPSDNPNQGRRRQRRSFFRARLPTTTNLSLVPLVSHHHLRRTLNSSNFGFGPTYSYAPMPMYSPMQYNSYLPNGYMSPQSMLMPPPQRIAPAMPGQYAMPSLPPSAGMQMLSPYLPQQQPMQMQIPPAYNNYAAPAPVPAGRNLYPSAPARLMTDWTGGGIISPGFLGPPI